MNFVSYGPNSDLRTATIRQNMLKKKIYHFLSSDMVKYMHHAHTLNSQVLDYYSTLQYALLYTFSSDHMCCGETTREFARVYMKHKQKHVYMTNIGRQVFSIRQRVRWLRFVCIIYLPTTKTTTTSCGAYDLTT